MRAWLIAGLILGLPLTAAAQQNGVEVTHVWSRPAMAGRTGVVYLTVTDKGAPDRLTGVSSPVAASADLHESFEDHGVMKMRPVAGLPVTPGKPVTLAPGGYHVMLMDLKQPLKTGESFPVTLTFEKAGAVTVQAHVEKAGATQTGHGGMGRMKTQ